jgi:hypothetical protein
MNAIQKIGLSMLAACGLSTAAQALTQAAVDEKFDRGTIEALVNQEQCGVIFQIHSGKVVGEYDHSDRLTKRLESHGFYDYCADPRLNQRFSISDSGMVTVMPVDVDGWHVTTKTKDGRIINKVVTAPAYVEGSDGVQKPVTDVLSHLFLDGLHNGAQDHFTKDFVDAWDKSDMAAAREVSTFEESFVCSQASGQCSEWLIKSFYLKHLVAGLEADIYYGEKDLYVSSGKIPIELNGEGVYVASPLFLADPIENLVCEVLEDSNIQPDLMPYRCFLLK